MVGIFNPQGNIYLVYQAEKKLPLGQNYMLSTSFYKKLHWGKIGDNHLYSGYMITPTYPSLRLDSFASAASHSRCHRRPRRLADDGFLGWREWKENKNPLWLRKTQKHSVTTKFQHSNCGCCEGFSGLLLQIIWNIFQSDTSKNVGIAATCGFSEYLGIKIMISWTFLKKTQKHNSQADRKS